jgi:hypothetical protein
MSERVPERRPASVDRWEPLRELEQATERMRRMLDDVFGGLGWPPMLGERAGWSPHPQVGAGPAPPYRDPVVSGDKARNA